MTTMNTVSGQHRIVFALREHGQDVEREVQDELAKVANKGAVMMKILANRRSGKTQGGVGALVQNIKPDQIDANTWQLGPHSDYARFVEDGVKPGGNGLPKYMGDVGASHHIVQWLRTTAYNGVHKPRKGSAALQRQDKDLRNRYFGLAQHIRRFGVKANPFVAPTAEALEPIMIHSLDLAVRRALGKRGAAV